MNETADPQYPGHGGEPQPDPQVQDVISALVTAHRVASEPAGHSPGYSAQKAEFDMAERVEHPRVESAQLRQLAAVPVEGDDRLVRLGTKVSALASFARAGYPDRKRSDVGDGYLALARAVAPTVEPERVLSDMRVLATSPELFAATETGQSLDSFHYALIGKDCVCSTIPVKVKAADGTVYKAAWIYSEFDTSTSLADCIDWMHPANWPIDSPLLFQAMLNKSAAPPLTSATTSDVTPTGGQNWSADFNEIVRLYEQINTSLHFEHQQIGGYAATSYILDNTIEPAGDGTIVIDRGFLSANDLGSMRHIKALKIVGFLEPRFTNEALTVCPIWTDFVKGAVEGAAISFCAADVGDSCEDLNSFVVDATSEYLDLGTRWAKSAVSKDYCVEDLAQDSAGAWIKLATDWSTAWSKGFEVMKSLGAESPIYGSAAAAASNAFQGSGTEDVASVGRITPAGPDMIETIVLPIKGLQAETVGHLAPLEFAGDPKVAIGAADVDVSIRRARSGEPGRSRFVLVLKVDTTKAQPGLYCGMYTFVPGGPTSSAAQVSVPVHFYASGAVAV